MQKFVGLKKANKYSVIGANKNGGEGEIRTLETLLTPTRVPGVRIQPLCHLSVGRD